MTTKRETPGSLTAVEAGQVLALPADVVRALADAGYLPAAGEKGGTPRFSLGDLKAFQARSVEGTIIGGGWQQHLESSGIDPEELVQALEGRATEMAERVIRVMASAFPWVAELDDRKLSRFRREAVDRIDAMITLCARGPEGGEPIEEDLAEVGADAAQLGIPLPGILMTLRVSRDLVVETAIELGEARGRHWGFALAVVLTRVLPAIDRLSDAVARGYWDAVLEIEAESLERYRNVVEQATDGVCEVGADGLVRYANPAFADLVGATADEMAGVPVERFVGAVELGAPYAEVTLARADGTRLPVGLRQFERVRDGVVVGWDAVAQRLDQQGR